MGFLVLSCADLGSLLSRLVLCGREMLMSLRRHVYRVGVVEF